MTYGSKKHPMQIEKIHINSRAPGETRKLGQIMGERISGGTFIGLTGDLGSGKTVFVQGLANGLNVPSEFYVTSPSYTLINEYPGRIKLFHVDLYRLDEPVDPEGLGLYEIIYGGHVTVIEWVERLHENVTGPILNMTIEIINENQREFSISASNLEDPKWLKKIQDKFKESI